MQGYSQGTADAFEVEWVEPSLLPAIRSPCLAAIQQCPDNTGLVDCNLCLHRQLGACPHSSRETGESWSCLFNPLVDICVQGEVVNDGGAEVGDLADSIEFIVVDGNDRRCFCEKQSINDWSSSWVWVATAASSANSMSLMRTLRNFVLTLRRARLKSLPSDVVRR